MTVNRRVKVFVFTAVIALALGLWAAQPAEASAPTEGGFICSNTWCYNGMDHCDFLSGWYCQLYGPWPGSCFQSGYCF